MNKQFGVISRRRLPVIAAMLVYTGSAWATMSNCPTSTGTAAALSSFGAQSAGNGCAQVDANFTNFSVTNTGTGSNSGVPSMDDVYMFGSGGAITGSGVSSTISPILADFMSDQWIENSSHTFTSDVDYQVAVNGASSPGPDSWEITGLTLGLGAYTPSMPSVDSVEVQEQFCLGATTFNCSTKSGNYGYIEELIVGSTITEIVCNNNGAAGCTPTTGSLSLSVAGFNTIAIQDAVTVSRNVGGGISVFLDGFDNQFNEGAEDPAAPEPSTFILLGSALGVVGLLRFRSQRVKSKEVKLG